MVLNLLYKARWAAINILVHWKVIGESCYKFLNIIISIWPWNWTNLLCYPFPDWICQYLSSTEIGIDIFDYPFCSSFSVLLLFFPDWQSDPDPSSYLYLPPSYICNNLRWHLYICYLLKLERFLFSSLLNCLSATRNLIWINSQG